MLEALAVGLLPEATERFIEYLTGTPIQVVYLMVGYAVSMDILTGLAYYKRRQLRRKYLGKTALFYCYDVNPRVRFRSANGTAAEIIPTWKAWKMIRTLA